MNEVLDFLTKYDYLVKIIPKKYLEVNIPEIKNRFTHKPAKNIIYQIKRGKNPGIIKTEEAKQVIDMPEYAVRLYICADIMRECSLIGYDHDYIQVFNKKGEISGYGINDEVINLMKEPKVDNFDKEQKLFTIFRECAKSGFLDIYEQEAIKSEIGEGYLLVRNLIEGEELE